MYIKTTYHPASESTTVLTIENDDDGVYCIEQIETFKNGKTIRGEVFLTKDDINHIKNIQPVA